MDFHYYFLQIYRPTQHTAVAVAAENLHDFECLAFILRLESKNSQKSCNQS